MKAESRVMARRHLDKRLQNLRLLTAIDRPPYGWLKAIREALGMTTAQLGKRLGVSQPRAVAIEKAEVNKTITLDTLERAAQAIDCQVAYVFIPRRSLDQLVEEKARDLACKQLRTIRHTMMLEAQPVEKNDEQEQFQHLVRNLVERSSSKLWET